MCVCVLAGASPHDSEIKVVGGGGRCWCRGCATFRTSESESGRSVLDGATLVDATTRFSCSRLHNDDDDDADDGVAMMMVTPDFYLRYRSRNDHVLSSCFVSHSEGSLFVRFISECLARQHIMYSADSELRYK